MIGQNHRGPQRRDLAKSQQPRLRIEHQEIARHQIHIRMLREGPLDPRERAGKILLVAIQPAADVAGGLRQRAIEPLVNPAVRLDEEPHIRLGARPILQLRAGARILHDVLDVHALVGHRTHATLQPGELAKAGRDDGELHSTHFRTAAGFPATSQSAKPSVPP